MPHPVRRAYSFIIAGYARLRKLNRFSKNKNGEQRSPFPLFGFVKPIRYLLRDLGSLAYAAAQVVQLRAANLTAANDLELSNVRGVYREGLLDAYAVRDAANGNRLVNASVLLGNDDALEHLDTLAVAFLDLCVYLNGIADLQLRKVVLELLLGQYFYQIPFFCLPFVLDILAALFVK